MGGVASIAYKDPADIDQHDKSNILSLEPGEKPSLEAIARKITSGDIKNIVCLCGAGISVSCGIPDFRSEGTGLYHNLQKYGELESPQSIFDIEFFKKNPKPFIHLAKELYPGQYKPSVTHYFMKLLNDKNKLLRVYTQNIDGLEYVAGLEDNKVIQCHGGFQTSHCINSECGALCDNDRLKKDILAQKETHCDKCSHLCKPGITFFGEALPQRYHDARSVDFVRKEAECCYNECKFPTVTLTLPDGEGTTRGFFCEWHSRHPGQNPPSEEENMEETATLKEEKEKEEVVEEKVKEEDKEDKEDKEEKITCAADLLIVLGTSLAVAPVAGLVDDVHWLCPRVLINRELVHLHGEPKPEWPPQFGPDNGFRFDSEDNYRDVACLMDCDEGTRQLAVLLGWEKELDALIAAAEH